MKVYLDNEATTPLDQEVIDVMMPMMQNQFGNPSSIHSYGREARSIIEKSRKSISKELNCSPGEIFFTSGGTEADNIAIRCGMSDLGINHAITSKIEHHAVGHTLVDMASKGLIRLSYVNLDKDGFVDLKHLEELLESNDRSFVSLMHANNEIGNLLPLKECGEVCKKHNAIFHSDTVQTMAHYRFDLQDLYVHFITAAAHKFHGPKGVGFAFVRKNSGIRPMIVGGAQERGMRAGTEPVYAIVGMVEALKISYQNLAQEKKYITGLKDYFKESLVKEIPEIQFNGHCDDNDKSSYTVLNVCIPVSPEKGTMLLFQLDLKGIACSKGSACQSGSNKGSHVLSEILKEEDLAKPSIRFSFSSFNTKDEIDYVVQTLTTFVKPGNVLEH